MVVVVFVPVFVLVCDCVWLCSCLNLSVLEIVFVNMCVWLKVFVFVFGACAN